MHCAMNRSASRHDRVSGVGPARRTALAGLAGTTLALLVLLSSGCATAPGASTAEQAEPPGAAYGIQVEGLRLTAAGSMLDFRYRVLDAQKAAPFLNGRIQPALLDESRGAKLGVPDTPTLGRIRQTSRNGVIRTDHTYFIMFGNPGKALRSGDRVSLLLGPVKVAELTVQ